MILISSVLLIMWSPEVRGQDRYSALRNQLVDQHIQGTGIQNARVIQSMRDTPRHEFMPFNKRRMAYFDMAVPIGHGQTISPPYIVAFMTDRLNPQPDDRVLEIGTGSGYQAAVLSPLVKDVYTIEIVEPLGQKAAKVFERLKYKNIHNKIGDGFVGWKEHAPFDKIIVTCSPENIPQPLIDQLVDGGQIVIPIGERFQQTLCRFTKRNGKLEREPLEATFFVPMTGQAEDNRKVKEDSTQPKIVQGSFEQTAEGSDLPKGWYYLRQGKVAADPTAPHGDRVLSFENRDPGRSAHALQSFGVDGLRVVRIAVNMWIRGDQIKIAPGRNQRARAIIEFYSSNRSPVGLVQLGPWTGSFDWKRVSKSIRVPPTARLAVIGIGLFGATGELSVDSVSIRPISEE